VNLLVKLNGIDNGKKSGGRAAAPDVWDTEFRMFDVSTRVEEAWPSRRSRAAIIVKLHRLYQGNMSWRLYRGR